MDEAQHIGGRSATSGHDGRSSDSAGPIDPDHIATKFRNEDGQDTQIETTLAATANDEASELHLTKERDAESEGSSRHERKRSLTNDAEALRRGLSFDPSDTGKGVGQKTRNSIDAEADPVTDPDEASAGDSDQSSTVRPRNIRRTTSKSFALPRSARKPREKTPVGEKFIPPGELDLETLDDMELAQRLGVSIEQEDHPPNRTVRRIVRGDPAKHRGKASKEPRRYLLAASLAEESKYAIECALGTVLRDGEVLIITFAIDKNSKTGHPQEGVDEKDDNSTAQAIASEATSLSEQTTRKPSRFESLKTWVPGSRKPSTSSEHVETKEQERQRSADELVTTCVHFLRRTALQVSVLVEVIHCQNAHHMLLAAVDSVQPALVIVGSRGLSQVHGSMGSSFSRAMIRKSSVPVMTARMKPSSKVKHSRSEKFMGNNLKPTENLVELSTGDWEQRQSRWGDMGDEKTANTAETPIETSVDGAEADPGHTLA